MKTIVDYLKKNKKYIHNTAGHYFELKLHNDDIALEIDGDVWLIDAYPPHFEVAYDIQNILGKYKIEIRFCDICGRPFEAGFTADDGSWYCCEDCFENTMDTYYGEGRWRGTSEEGIFGGFYECLDVDGKWFDTGIYYTEWN